jgi:ATP-dependent Zn protease
VALLIGGLYLGRRLYIAVKELMKAGGSNNMLDMDTKKIEAIKPENINTLFKDVAGMHEAKF